MLRPRLTERDQGCRLREAVDMGQLPPEIAFDQFNRRRCGRRTRREQTNTARRVLAEFFRRVRNADQYRRCGAEHCDVLIPNELVDQFRVDLAQAHMRHTPRGIDPGERPTVRMKHRQGPKITVRRCQVMMRQGSHDVHVCIAMRDHHALRPRGRPTGIVDRQKIGFGNLDFGIFRRCRSEPLFVIDPTLARAFERDEVLDTCQLVPDAVDSLEIILMRADHLRAAMIDNVFEIFRQQTVVDRHKHRAHLGHGVVSFKMGMRVRRNIGNPVALADAHPLQGGRPPIAAIEELRVTQP